MEQPKRVGRPPRIDLDAIADAVLELGFDGITMRRVADHLGVSVPGLYHYVRGRSDLVRVAASRALAQVELPSDEGQHWAEWLRAWGRYIRTALSSRPELVEQFMAGGLDDVRLGEVVRRAVAFLERAGFSPADATAAWEAVSAVALGSAVGDIRERDGVGSFEERLTTVIVGVAVRYGRPVDSDVSGSR